MTMFGKQVGRFKIGNHVGEGRYAVVLEAHAPDDPKKYIIKIQSKNLIAKINPKFIERELKAYKKMKHVDGVPDFIEFHQDNDYAYFITEFVNGYHLQRELIEREILKKGEPMLIEEKKDIMLQAIQIIRSLHKVGVYHGDLKLENILLCKGKVYIIDFGCSILQDEPINNVDRNLLGTPGFSPPETCIFSKEKIMNLETIDVWGLCNILYYLFTGNFAFGNVNVGQTIKSVQTCDYIKEGLNPKIKRICDKVFRRNPNDRINLDRFEKLIKDLEL